MKYKNNSTLLNCSSSNETKKYHPEKEAKHKYIEYIHKYVEYS